MAEAFHQWVNNMPWYEKLYYQLFDPQAINCTTYAAPQLGFALIPVIIVVIILAIFYWKANKEVVD